MVCVCMLVVFVLCLLVLPFLAEEVTGYHPSCHYFHCGKLGRMHFPFSNASRPAHCGFLMLDGCHNDTQRIQLEREGRWYEIINISQPDWREPYTIFMRDEFLQKRLFSHSCETFNNLSFPSSPFLSLQIVPNLTLFKCNQPIRDATRLDLISVDCGNLSLYHTRELKSLPSRPPQCSLIQLPGLMDWSNNDIFTRLTANFSLIVVVSGACWDCHHGRGECQIRRKKFYCSDPKEGNKNLGLKLGLGLGIGCPFVGIILFTYIFWSRFRKKRNSMNLLSNNSSSDPSSKVDIEEESVYFGIPIFSYAELQEATNNFDSDEELGDGGFGTVYYGKLKDGREVAVKRLYEHNYRRVKQFMTEIEILTRLRHKNLVCLYGCTSRRSRELLLVYEYIPNGTVADHLHGDKAKSSVLAWPIRMSIAIETATALAYLHASDIVHRDVKTNNILLDNNFCVKVADFGLSRLFPNDVTHVSTVPQGTPGYVDPGYHQCYQLTAKSDVYSFGVVLIELISSMPAVDITRHQSEINLSNLAISKIQKCAFDELIDSRLGYNSDEEVTRITTSVAELAFQCLQQDKEMRPSMDDVLEELKRIQGGESEENQEEVHDDHTVSKSTMPPASSPYCDEAALLKNIRVPPSPDSVTNKWISSSTATNDSG